MYNTNFKLCAFADEASPALDGQIAALAENGINLLEMRGVDGKNVSELTEAEAREAARKLSTSGISVWSIGSPCGKSEISAPFEVELDKFKRVLQTAHITGAKNIRIFSFYGTEGKPEYRDEVFSRLSRFIEAAEGSEVTLCHENERGIYGDNAARCAELHAALPELRAVFDPANFILLKDDLTGQDTLAAWKLLSGYVKYLHIKDAIGGAGGGPGGGAVMPAGEGAGRIREILAARVAESSGVTVLSIEPHLSKFVGLDKLEQAKNDAVGHMAFADKREAFDYAVGALKKLLEKV